MGVRDQHHTVVKYLQLPESAWPALARLSGLQVGIWADAWTWQQQGQRAFRTNDQLATMFGANPRSIQRAIKTMEQLGILEVGYQGKMRFLHAKGDKLVTLTNRSPKGDRCGNEGRPIGHGKGDRPVTQVYHSRTISKSPNKSMRVRAELEGVNEGLHFPWTSDRFMVAWQDFKEYMRVEHRYGFKSEHAEQLALVNLKNNFEDEQSAITAIGKTMASGWKSIPAPKTRTRGTRVDRTPGHDGNTERTAGRNF
jgi:hypothetical protein